MTGPDVLHAISGRLAAALAALTVLGAACGGGGTTERADRGSPSPTPLSIALGSETEEGEVALTPAPGRSTQDGAPAGGGVPSPVPDDPADAVRAWFAALEAEDHAAQQALTAGPAHALMRVRGVIAQHNARQGATTQTTVEIREEPALEDRAGEGARVTARAVLRETVSGERGALPSETNIEGPVTLRFRDGSWLVSDLVYAGRTLAPEHVPIGATSEQDGLRLTLDLLQGYKGTTAALVRLTNEAGGQIDIQIERATLIGPDGAEREHGQIAVETAPNPIMFIGFPHDPARPTGFRLIVNRKDTGNTVEFSFSF